MELLPEGAPCTSPSYLTRPISEGFGELHSLEELRLGGCIKLKALPAGLNAFPPACCSHHRSLHPPFTLNHPRTAWPNPPFSEGFGELRSLTSLNLGSCYKLEALPAGLYAFPPACCSHHRSLHPPFTLNHSRTTRPPNRYSPKDSESCGPSPPSTSSSATSYCLSQQASTQLSLHVVHADLLIHHAP